MKNEIVANSIINLGILFKKGDERVLEAITERKMKIAFLTSHRTEKNGECLSPYIEEAVIAAYQLRGAEGLSSLSKSGKNVSINDIDEKLKKNIISAGLRLLP